MLQHYGNHQFSPDICDKIFQAFDVNQDGVMDQKEQCTFIKTLNSDPNKIYEIAGLDKSGSKKLVKTAWDGELESALDGVPQPPLKQKVQAHLNKAGASVELDMGPNQVFAKMIVKTDTSMSTSTFTFKWG